MRATVVAGVLAIVAATSLGAQEVQPVVKEGARSVNFTFDGLGSLGLGAAGVNGGISGTYFLKQNRALRLGLQVGYTRSTTPWNGAGPGSDGHQSTFTFGISGDYLWYGTALAQRVRPYVGTGASVVTNSSDRTFALSDAAPAGTLTEIKDGSGSDGLTLGAEGVLGVEFFLFPSVSLSAEYHLNVVSYTSRADQVQYYNGGTSVTTKQGSTLSLLRFAAGGATVHIYF